MSVLERDDMHYENILGYLQVQSQRTHQMTQDYYGLYLYLTEIVYGILRLAHVKNIGLIEENIRYLDGLTSLVRQNSPLWIFSLNHDLIMECFSSYAGIPLNCGFTEEVLSLPRRDRRGELVGELKAQVLPEQVLRQQGLPFFVRGQIGINLLKIHGSLDIFTFRDGHDVLKLLPYGEGVNGVVSALEMANQDLRYNEPTWPGGVLHSTNEILYEDETGEMQFLRRSLLVGAHKFDPLYSQVIPNELLTYFESSLNYVTTLICIGYSFGDQHINRVIQRWLDLHPSRRLTIVDPAQSGVPDAFRHLSPQVELIQSDCTDYLDKLGAISRTKSDQSKRRLTEWIRKEGSDAVAKWEAFVRQEMAQYRSNLVEWFKSLPIRDGDLDLEGTGVTMEELIETGISAVGIQSLEQIHEKFLQSQLTTSNR